MKRIIMSRHVAGPPTMLALLLLTSPLVSSANAQQPPPPVTARTATATTTTVTVEKLPEGVEVLMRGPVHQAFAQPYPENEPMMQIERPVPAPLRERPAAARPSDPERTAQWLPGYWAIDPESQDLLWVSGIWRYPPPGMQWVPGYWNTRGATSSWVSGFWVDERIEELEFVSRPPEPRETVPADEPPSENHFWVPGYWVYERGEFAWEPGTWAEARRGWVWEPTRYLETPSGWVLVDGYWDYEPHERGLLFAPVRFDRETIRVTQEVRRPVLMEEIYWPQVAIEPRQAMVHWFTQPAYTHYYFGNYYDPVFAQRGLVPWVGYQQQATVFDPLFWYYRTAQPALLGQMVQARSRVIAQPNLQPAAVFSTDIAAAQLPDYVQTVDMLTGGDRAEAFTRVESEVLDEYREQLQGYADFTDERLALRAELGDEGAAAEQEQQQSEQRRSEGEPQERRTEARASAESRDPAEQPTRSPSPESAEDAQRPAAPRPDEPRRGESAPQPTRPTEPGTRGDDAPADRPRESAREPQTARPQERPGDQPRAERPDAQRERPDGQPRPQTERPDAPSTPRATPADPSTRRGAEPRPPSQTEPRPGAPADSRPGSPAEPRPGAPADPRGEPRPNATDEPRGQTPAERRQPRTQPPQQQLQQQQQQLQQRSQQQPDAGAGISPSQRMNLNRLRQIQMPEGLPRAQGVPQGQQPQFAPPQRLGRPGLQPGQGPAGRAPQQGGPQGRQGLLQRLGPGGR